MNSSGFQCGLKIILPANIPKFDYGPSVNKPNIVYAEEQKLPAPAQVEPALPQLPPKKLIPDHEQYFVLMQNQVITGSRFDVIENIKQKVPITETEKIISKETAQSLFACNYEFLQIRDFIKLLDPECIAINHEKKEVIKDRKKYLSIFCADDDNKKLGWSTDNIKLLDDTTIKTLQEAYYDIFTADEYEEKTQSEQVDDD